MRKKVAIGGFIVVAILIGSLILYAINKDQKEANNFKHKQETGLGALLPEESVSSAASTTQSDYSSKFVGVFGKWRVIERIGSGYAFTDIPEKSYIGGEITITDELVQCSMPDKELNYTIKDPKYVMQWQSRNDFYMEHYANYDSFGFENPEKVPKIEIKKKGQSLGFGSTLWIKDENHIIIMGPQYFLAEKQSN